MNKVIIFFSQEATDHKIQLFSENKKVVQSNIALVKFCVFEEKAVKLVNFQNISKRVFRIGANRFIGVNPGVLLFEHFVNLPYSEHFNRNFHAKFTLSISNLNPFFSH